MAALMRLKVVPAEGKGESFDIAITPKVIVESERHFARPMGDLFGESASYEALCWAAWKGCQVAGRIVPPFDEWLVDIDSIEAGEAPRVPLESR